MPQQAQFAPARDLLSASEIVYICSNLVDLGIDEMRVSGGEPTLRKDFLDIIRGLSELSVGRLGVTTNGYFLKSILSKLRRTRCQHINISLDSLNQKSFRLITKTDCFDRVFESVVAAKEMNFRVKVNVVILRGINDHELFDFIKFSARHGIEVRFLELMKIGPYYKNHSELFVSAEELIERIEERENLEPRSVSCDSTSFNFRTSSGAEIGFIASESQSFCGFCSRLRLTAAGKLRACIMSEEGISLRHVPKERYSEILRNVMAMKPLKRLDYIEQPMYQIGG